MRDVFNIHISHTKKRRKWSNRPNKAKEKQHIEDTKKKRELETAKKKFSAIEDTRKPSIIVPN